MLKLDGVVADPQPSAKILRDHRGRAARRRQGREPAGQPRPVRHHPCGDRRCRPAEARARAAPDPRAAGPWVRAARGRSDEPDVRAGPAAPAGRRRGAVERDGRRRGRDHQGQRRPRCRVSSRWRSSSGSASVFLALLMGWLLRRSAQHQSDRFRSLVHNSTDLITVLDEHAVARYQSPSSMRVLGYEAGRDRGHQAHRPAAPRRQATRHRGLRARVRPARRDRRAPLPAAAPQRRVPATWRAPRRTSSRTAASAGFVVNSRDVTEREQAAAELAVGARPCARARRRRSRSSSRR